MSVLMEEKLNLFLLQEKIWVITNPVHKSNYDFEFERFFNCEHKWQLPPSLSAIARVGARNDYKKFYESLRQDGVHLIHSPEQHALASELPNWYPLISDLTPRSLWFSQMPTLEHIQENFTFPIFVKGARQTSKHQKSLSIIENAQDFNNLTEKYKQDSILHWQDIVCREYLELRSIKGDTDEGIPPSYEFRTFWYKGHLVGAGRYWFEMPKYNWTAQEKSDAMKIASEAASRVDVPFLVIDVAQRIDGQWIVIECNDGQESGYAGLSPIALWKNILSVETGLSSS